MIVCLCEGVSDRAIREVVDRGASNVREIADQTGAGTHCGMCACDLRRIADTTRAGRPQIERADGVTVLLRR